MVAYQTHKFVDVFDSFIHNYNNRFHSSTGLKPADVNAVQEAKLNFTKHATVISKINSQFSISQKVTIKKSKII